LRGLDPRIHAFVSGALEGVDGRAKPGQDETEIAGLAVFAVFAAN
jgi:hypothetical protein